MTKAYQTSVFNNKICYQLQQDKVRHQIIGRKLQQGDCDNEEVCEFLKLLVKQRKKMLENLGQS